MTYLDLKIWNADHSFVWREIESRLGRIDYEDENKRTGHENTLKLEWEAKQYARNRATGYPSIEEQLDMQYHDQVNGTTKWKDIIEKVKADNPKT